MPAYYTDEMNRDGSLQSWKVLFFIDETSGRALFFTKWRVHVYSYQGNGLLFDVWWREDGLPLQVRTLNAKYHQANNAGSRRHGTPRRNALNWNTRVERKTRYRHSSLLFQHAAVVGSISNKSNDMAETCLIGCVVV
jgi:hypothetical protein